MMITILKEDYVGSARVRTLVMHQAGQHYYETRLQTPNGQQYAWRADTPQRAQLCHDAAYSRALDYPRDSTPEPASQRPEPKPAPLDPAFARILDLD